MSKENTKTGTEPKGTQEAKGNQPAVNENGKPIGTSEPYKNSQTLGGKALGKGKEIGKKVGKAGLKQAKTGAKNAIKNSDTAVGKTWRAADKTKKAAQKAKKAMSAIVKYVQFCISNPLGWICGVVTIIVMANLFGAIADSLNSDLAKSLGSASGGHSWNANVKKRDGDKVVTILADCAPEDIAVSDTTTSDAAANSDWTKEGTEAWKNAKSLFDAWINAGLSGEAAAGIVGWVDSEGGFDMVGRAEGHYGGKKEENSIKYGVVPIPSGPGYTVGGGGIYQFTPYTKYGQLSEDKWEDGKTMTEFVIKQLPADWAPSHDMTGGNHTFEQFAQHTVPEEAGLMWNAYERGNQSLIPVEKKRANAKKANEVFNKEGHKFDRAKYDKAFGGSKGDPAASGSSESDDNKGCAPKKRKGGKGWSEDGTGTHNYTDWNMWKPHELPDDLKQYALDPESMGMKFGSSEGWEALASGINNQCTDLSASLMYKLWQKDGQGPKQLRGNGIDVANNWAATYGGEVSKEPTSGAVWSATSSHGAAGHTGVVSHVFADGSILIIEQNVTGMSGQGNGTTFTWNYRIVTKKGLEADNYVFYDPSEQGYTVNPDATSL